MKKNFRIVKIIALFTATVALSSCDNMVVEPVETTANGKARLSVTLAGGTARTILPTDISESEITQAELLAKASGADSFAAVKSWSSDGSASAIVKMSADSGILIDAGTYDFTLNLYATFNEAETLCQTGTLASVAVAQGSNPLSFTTKYVAGNGKLSGTLTWTADDRIALVKAGLFTAESDGESAVAGYELADLEIAGDAESGFSATYAKEAVPSGTYFVRFELFSADGTKINTLEDVAKIAAACTTTKTIALANVNTIYAITYNLNGGTWAADFTAPKSRNANKAVLLPTAENLTRTGYDFAGWHTSADGGTTLSESAVESIGAGEAGDVALWAQWTAHEYAITYELGENATNASENPATYTIESATITLADPTRTGYDFTGWYKGDTSDEANKVTEITSGSTGDVTLTAGWKVVIYTITYELDGGTNSEANPTTYTIEDEIILKEATKNYYTFAGWSADIASADEPIVKIQKGSTGDRTLYAQWLYFRQSAGYTGDVVFEDSRIAPADKYAQNKNAYKRLCGNPVGITAFGYSEQTTRSNGGGNAEKKGTYMIGLKIGTGLAWCTKDAFFWTGSPNPCYIGDEDTWKTQKWCADKVIFGIYSHTDGSDTWETMKANTSEKNDTSNPAKYPAFYFAENYAETAEITKNYTNDWYIPSATELCKIYRNREILKNSFYYVTGSRDLFQYSSDKYWSSSRYDARGDEVWIVQETSTMSVSAAFRERIDLKTIVVRSVNAD